MFLMLWFGLGTKNLLVRVQRHHGLVATITVWEGFPEKLRFFRHKNSWKHPQLSFKNKCFAALLVVITSPSLPPFGTNFNLGRANIIS